MQLVIINNDQSMYQAWKNLLDQRLEPIDCSYFNLILPKTPLTFTTPPNIILFLARLHPLAVDQEKQAFQNAVHFWAKEAHKQGVPFLFLSSAAVFKGDQLYYDEMSEVCPNDSHGHFYVDCERQALSFCQNTILLRTGWLFSAASGQFLAEVIEYARSKKRIKVNSAGKGCPTSLNDLVRVILAMCLQIELGVVKNGIFHYVSTDSAIGFQFIETILSHASQFDGDIDPKTVLFQHQVSEDNIFFFEPVILRCQKLLEQFGVHQRTWRSYVGDSVKNYCSEVMS